MIQKTFENILSYFYYYFIFILAHSLAEHRCSIVPRLDLCYTTMEHQPTVWYDSYHDVEELPGQEVKVDG